MPTENILFRVPFGYLDVKIILCSILNFAQSFTQRTSTGHQKSKGRDFFIQISHMFTLRQQFWAAGRACENTPASMGNL